MNKIIKTKRIKGERLKDKEVYKRIVEEQKWCQLCGKSNNLHIHHIFYRSQGGLTVEKNLIRLCINCHNLVHSNKKKYQKMLLDIQYSKYGYFDKSEVLRCKDYFNVNL